MIPVELQTSDGSLVVRGRIPPFNEEPRVIIWGTRLFAYYDTTGKANLLIYRECFAVALVNHD